MYSEIIKNLKTKKDVFKLEEELEYLLGQIYEKKGQGYEQALKEKIRAWVAEAITQELEKEKIAKDDYLQGLKKRLKKLKELKLTISFEPTTETIEKLHAWVSSSLGSGVVIELEVNPRILGGAIVTYKGEYKDLSLRKKFDRIFASQTQEFLKYLS